MAHDVYICYSAKDKAIADTVCRALESEGIRCWIAPRDILPAMDWAQSVIKAINRTRLFVLIFTAEANASLAIHREVERAMNRGIPILPLRIEDATPSGALAYFVSVHGLDALPPLERHLKKLAQRIGYRLLPMDKMGPLPAARPPAVPAARPAQPAPAPPSPVTTLSEPRVATAPAATQRDESRETPLALVDFSVYAPSHVRPGSSFLLNVWACLPAQRAAMVERATGSSRKVEAGSRGGILLPSETPLLLRLRLDGFTVDNPLEPFAWHGEVTNVSFLVSAPAQLAPGVYPGAVELLDGGMLIGKFYFEVTVNVTEGATPPTSQAELRADWMRSAFASYASPDREKVVQRVQGMTAAGVKVYLDVASLRTGHQWQQQLFHAIENADVFYLFWSRFAKASEHVEREWRTALDKKGLTFIHPIPLEDPRQAQPPDELSSLHFNDIYLAILKTSTPGE